MTISFQRIRRYFPAFLVLSLLALAPWSVSAQTGTWVTVLSEDFEGEFPGTLWELEG